MPGRPNPDFVARAKRRIFTGEFKQRVLDEADKAKEESAGIGALLRRGSVLFSPGDVAARARRGNPAPPISELLEAAGEGTKMADHLSPVFRPAFPSSAIISERSSP